MQLTCTRGARLALRFTCTTPRPSSLQNGIQRQITIVQTGITIRIAQPWWRASNSWAPWLNVGVTLTLPPPPPAPPGSTTPSVDMGGLMGSTLPSSTRAYPDNNTPVARSAATAVSQDDGSSDPDTTAG